MNLWQSLKNLGFYSVIAVATSFPFCAQAQEPTPEKCTEAVKSSVTHLQLIATLAQGIKDFTRHLQDPRFAGASPVENLNNFGNFVQKNKEYLKEFHQDFDKMMKSFEALKGKKLTEREAKLAFALVLDQVILSRSFVVSYYAAQRTLKLVDRTVVPDNRYYSTEEADIAVFGVLSESSRIINMDLDEDDTSPKQTRISLEAAADRIVEALVNNPFHPDSLMEGVQMTNKLFSTDPAVRAQAEEWLKAKTERAQRLRGPFRQNWMKTTKEK
jgi:hypothetical protein